MGLIGNPLDVGFTVVRVSATIDRGGLYCPKMSEEPSPQNSDDPRAMASALLGFGSWVLLFLAFVNPFQWLPRAVWLVSPLCSLLAGLLASSD